MLVGKGTGGWMDGFSRGFFLKSLGYDPILMYFKWRKKIVIRISYNCSQFVIIVRYQK